MARNARVAKPFYKDGIFYVRRRVPQDLVAVVGKQLYLKSLGTGVAAEAAQRFPAANAAATSYFQQLRTSTGSWPSQPAVRLSMIGAAIDRLLREAPDRQRNATKFVFMQSGLAISGSDDSPSSAVNRLPPAQRAHLAGELLDGVEAFLPSGPLPMPVRTEVLKELENRLPDFLTNWRIGLDFETEAERRFTPPEPERDPDVTLTKLMSLWVQDTKPCKSAHDDAKSVVRDFTGFYGNIPVRKFTRDDFDFFAEELRKLPAHMSQAERALPFAERVKLGEDQSRKKAKGATTAKKLTLLKAIMALSLKKNRIVYNPAQGLATGHSYHPDARRQMTSTEARMLFSLPIFTKPSEWTFDREISDATVAWVGLIGLVSGSRLGEIAQAQVHDVLVDEGHVALSITASEGGEHEQGVKTPGSQRVIVIHRQVVSLGFLDYIAAIRESGSTLLFADVAVSGGGLRTKEVSRRLNQLVDEVLARPELVFYSLRHTFKAQARAAGVSPDIERQMTGHAAPDVSGKYGLAFVSQLAAEMDKITFPMIPWAEIRRAWQGVDWQFVARRGIS